MKKYMSVYVTICEDSSLHGAYINYTDEEADVDLSFKTDYEQGMKELRKLEKLLGKPAQLTVNRYNPTISYKTLYGYIDRE